MVRRSRRGRALELFFAADDVLTRGGGGARPAGEDDPPYWRALYWTYWSQLASQPASQPSQPSQRAVLSRLCVTKVRAWPPLVAPFNATEDASNYELRTSKIAIYSGTGTRCTCMNEY